LGPVKFAEIHLIKKHSALNWPTIIAACYRVHHSDL
jgi:hypothetical protein